jgi:hypothetical protein
MSSISVRMGLSMTESQVQLGDQAKRYLSPMVKTAEVIKRRCWRKYDVRAGGEEIADTGISLNCSPAQPGACIRRVECMQCKVSVISRREISRKSTKSSLRCQREEVPVRTTSGL